MIYNRVWTVNPQPAPLCSPLQGRGGLAEVIHSKADSTHLDLHRTVMTLPSFLLMCNIYYLGRSASTVCLHNLSNKAIQQDVVKGRKREHPYIPSFYWSQTELRSESVGRGKKTEYAVVSSTSHKGHAQGLQWFSGLFIRVGCRSPQGHL